MSILDMLEDADFTIISDDYAQDLSPDSSDTESPPDEFQEHLLKTVREPDVSLDEMLSLACRQGKLDIVQLLTQSGAHVNHCNKAGNTPLLEACSQGHVDVAIYLLENGSSIETPTETTMDSALTWACTLGNTDIVDALIKKNANVEHRTKDGCTALMFACLAGHRDVAEKLLDAQSEINVESDSNKDSPLTFACWKGHGDVVDLLLERKANIEHRTKEGFSPLMFAALGGHTVVAKKLLDKMAQVNQPSGSNNDIPLTSACWKGHHKVVELLLQYTSNIEHRTKDGCTPLMLAAREGHFLVAKLLLENKAEVNTPSGSESNIPLTLACWKGHCEVVRLLLAYNSNIEHRNKAGCTPLMLASREGHLETTQLLLEHNAEVNIPSGSNDDTPLTLACWKGHTNVVLLLLEYKSIIDHQTKTGCTPLMEATREGHRSVAEILLKHNADVELPDNYGQSPLFMACWKGHQCVAELLLLHGAQRDCRTKTGITPLFQACRENHVSIVELLLDHGASVNSPFPNSRENPITLSAEKGHRDLVNLLLSRGATHDCHTKKGCTPAFLSCKEGHIEIAKELANEGANFELSDCRGTTPIVASFKNGHVQIVEWLVNHVHHLPSDELCHKILMSSVDDKEKELMLQRRSKCLTIIQEVKKKREQLALKNAQNLVKELDDERDREETKKKKQAAKRRDKRNKRKKNKDESLSAEIDGEVISNPEKSSEPEESEEVIDNEETLEKGSDENINDDADDDFDDEDEGEDEDELQNFVEPQENRDGCDYEQFDQVNVSDTPQDNTSTVSKEEKIKSQVISSQSVPSGKSNAQSQKSRRKGKDKAKVSEQKPAALVVTKPQSVDLSSTTISGKASVSSATQITETSKAVSISIEKSLELSCVAGKETMKNAPQLLSPKTSGVSTQSTSTSGSSRIPQHSNTLTSTTNSFPKSFPTQNQYRKKSSRHTNSSVPPITSVAVTTSNTLVTTVSDSRSDARNLSPTCVDDWDEHSTVKVKNGEFEEESPNVSQEVTRLDTSNEAEEFRESNWSCTVKTSKAIHWEIIVPNGYCGRVIGKAGKKINHITEESGAQITVEKPTTTVQGTTKRLIRIRGSPSAAEKARNLITKALNTSSFSKSEEMEKPPQPIPDTATKRDTPDIVDKVSHITKSESNVIPATPSIPHGLLPYSKVATGEFSREDVEILQKQLIQQTPSLSSDTPKSTEAHTGSNADNTAENASTEEVPHTSELDDSLTQIVAQESITVSPRTTPNKAPSKYPITSATTSHAAPVQEKNFSYFSPWSQSSPDISQKCSTDEYSEKNVTRVKKRLNPSSTSECVKQVAIVSPWNTSHQHLTSVSPEAYLSVAPSTTVNSSAFSSDEQQETSPIAPSSSIPEEQQHQQQPQSNSQHANPLYKESNRSTRQTNEADIRDPKSSTSYHQPHDSISNQASVKEITSSIASCSVDNSKQSQMSTWTIARFQDMKCIGELLLSLSLEKYTGNFEDHGITLDGLRLVNESRLQSIGIPKGPRLKILKACQLITPEVKNQTQPNPVGTQHPVASNTHQPLLQQHAFQPVRQQIQVATCTGPIFQQQINSSIPYSNFSLPPLQQTQHLNQSGFGLMSLAPDLAGSAKPFGGVPSHESMLATCNAEFSQHFQMAPPLGIFPANLSFGSVPEVKSQPVPPPLPVPQQMYYQDNQALYFYPPS